MRLRLHLPTLLLLACAPALHAADTPAVAPTPCDAHDWFTPTLPRSPLCAAADDASFDRRRPALHRLHALLRATPTGPEAYRAHELLWALFFRAGQYRRALAETDALLRLDPHAADQISLRPLLLALSQAPDQTAQSRTATLPDPGLHDGNPHLPVLANRTPALWFMDTGANLSLMSDSEAAALHLTVHPVTTQMGDISGTMTALRVTTLPHLRVGRTTLRHVAFLVLPHTQPPFDTMPTTQQALLGIQVLRALGTIRIDPANNVTLGATPPRSATSTPLVYLDTQPIVQMTTTAAGQPLPYTLDTGAQFTTLNPPFATALPALAAAGEHTTHRLTGVAGSTQQPALTLPAVDFTLAGRPVRLAPATLLLAHTTGNSDWAAGNLGYDLLQQAAPFTIDFRGMRLLTEPRP